jgi:hypothetical protein
MLPERSEALNEARRGAERHLAGTGVGLVLTGASFTWICNQRYHLQALGAASSSMFDVFSIFDCGP